MRANLNFQVFWDVMPQWRTVTDILNNQSAPTLGTSIQAG